jgi:hypothetical protein
MTSTVLDQVPLNSLTSRRSAHSMERAKCTAVTERRRHGRLIRGVGGWSWVTEIQEGRSRSSNATTGIPNVFAILSRFKYVGFRRPASRPLTYDRSS